MLEELSGIREARITRPEEKPRWLDMLVNLEIDNESVFPRNREQVIREKVKQIPDLALKDLADYIILQDHFTLTNGEAAELGLKRGHISAAMLEKVQDEGLIYLDGAGQRFDYLFYELENRSEKPRRLIVDNFQGTHLISSAWLNDTELIVANSGEDILSGAHIISNNTVILANCQMDTLFGAPYVEMGENILIIANSTFKGSDGIYLDRPPYLIAVNCRQGVLGGEIETYDHIRCTGRERIAEDDFQQIRRLGLEMEGKNGLEVYQLGKKIVEILKAGEKRA